MSTRHRLVSGYLLLQAMSVAAWWIWLCTSKPARERFTFAGWPEESLLAFAVPDAVLLVFGSALAARAIVQHKAWAPLAAWLVAGAAAYATLFCIAGSVLTGSMWLGTVMMLACTAGSTWVALASHPSRTA